MLLLLSLLEAAATTPTESAEAETWESKGKKWDLGFSHESAVLKTLFQNCG